MLIGAPYWDNSGGITDCGAAYMYVRSITGWAPQKRLIASDSTSLTDRWNYFGMSVAFYLGTALIGAPYDDSTSLTDTGAAYLFVPNKPPNTPSNPYPPNGALLVINNQLSWTGGDPDGDPVTYDVYFEANDATPDVLRSSHQGANSYKPGTLTYSTTYYWQIVAYDSHGVITNGPIWHFTTGPGIINSPPVFGNPSPDNSVGNQPLSLTFSLPINDPNGDLFSFTIQCSNGQKTFGTLVTGGTKALVLSGLAYSTTYKVYVNATDPAPGSDLYTRGVYTFTTMSKPGGNQPPVITNPRPAGGSTNQPLSFTFYIDITDPEANPFTWTITCSNGLTKTRTGQTGGTYSMGISGLTAAKTYTVWVNATDPNPPGSGQYTRKVYTFTTQGGGGNQPPVITTPAPPDGSTGQPLSFTFSISITDPETNPIDWTIQCSNGQTKTRTGQTGGTYSMTLVGLTAAKTYKVWVNATDPIGSNMYTRRSYTYTTQ
jgi:hypothetical protein